MSSSKDKLINAAVALFNENGFHATGINLILKKSGVAKKTLYTHFKSKDDLIVQALLREDGLFRRQFVIEVEKIATKPTDKLLALYDVAHAWFLRDSFFGCIFVNAVAEFPESDSEVRSVCKANKAEMVNYIRQVCVDAGAVDPAALADKLALILEGSIATALVSGKPDAANTAKKTAQIVIEKAMPALPPRTDGLIGRLFG